MRVLSKTLVILFMMSLVSGFQVQAASAVDIATPFEYGAFGGCNIVDGSVVSTGSELAIVDFEGGSFLVEIVTPLGCDYYICKDTFNMVLLESGVYSVGVYTDESLFLSQAVMQVDFMVFHDDLTGASGDVLSSGLIQGEFNLNASPMSFFFLTIQDRYQIAPPIPGPNVLENYIMQILNAIETDPDMDQGLVMDIIGELQPQLMDFMMMDAGEIYVPEVYLKGIMQEANENVEDPADQLYYISIYDLDNMSLQSDIFAADYTKWSPEATVLDMYTYSGELLIDYSLEDFPLWFMWLYGASDIGPSEDLKASFSGYVDLPLENSTYSLGWGLDDYTYEGTNDTLDEFLLFMERDSAPKYFEFGGESSIYTSQGGMKVDITWSQKEELTTTH